IGPKQMELHFCRKYYNPRLQKIVREIRDKCKVCLQAKRTYYQYGTLGVIGPAKKPFEIIHIDTKSGYRKLGSEKDSVHCSVDAFSRFAWSVQSKTKLAVDFIQLINKVMAIEKPKLIIADN